MSLPVKPASLKLATMPTELNVLMVLQGPSRAGKSVSAAILATYFAKQKGGKVLVISGEPTAPFMYQKQFGYDVHVVESCHPQYLTDLIHLAEEQYAAIVFDPVSIEWTGPDGVLATATAETQAMGGKAYTQQAWGKVTPMHDAFTKAVIECKTHMFSTMQVKNKVRQITDEEGKKTWKTVIGDPIQRAGFIDLFTTNILIDADGIAGIWKHRSINGANTKGMPQQGTRAWEPTEESTLKFAEKYSRWLKSLTE